MNVMSHPERGPTPEPYPFTDRERLYDRITTDRLLGLIADPATQVHQLELASNTYGEFLFVTTSRLAGERRAAVTFWGAGYHEQRERWLTREWFWHRSELTPARSVEMIDPETARDAIEARLAEIAVYGNADRQTTRGQLFEFLADLTDDDGALADLEDMAGWLLDIDSPDE